MDLLFTLVSVPPGAQPNQRELLISSSENESVTIGRAATNLWVLDDPERIVSSNHATIGHQGDTFILTDISTNGTFINNNPAPIGAGNTTPLKNGDTISIGQYRLQVSVKQDTPSASLPDGLESVDFLDTGTSIPKPEANSGASEHEDDFDKWLQPAAQASGDLWKGSIESNNDALINQEETDPLAALDQSASLTPEKDLWHESPSSSDDDGEWWKTSFSDKATPDKHVMEPMRPAAPTPKPIEPAPQQQQPSTPTPPPPVEPPRAAIPEPQVYSDDDYFQPVDMTQPGNANITATPNLPPEPAATRSSTDTVPPAIPPEATVPPVPPPVAPKPPPTPPSAAQAPRPSTAAVDSVKMADDLGLGVLSSDKAQDVASESTMIVQETIARLMQLLSARATIKNELRVERTMIRSSENNPLKFSPSPEEAIKAMFSGEGSAFLSPVAAVSEGFEDITDHQIAVLAGMKAAFSAMLAEFDPLRLEQKVKTSNDALAMLTSKKAKLWDGYDEYYRTLTRDMEKSYQQLFGQAFAEAYELQLVKLKGMRKL